MFSNAPDALAGSVRGQVPHLPPDIRLTTKAVGKAKCSHRWRWHCTQTHRSLGYWHCRCGGRVQES